MCGIAGELRAAGRGRPEVVEAQLQALLHRGPDAAAAQADGPSCIGQTRLAVIDLVTGDPPITTPDGRIGVAFNGEIYNYAELRQALLARGHVFRTQGDTEVIAHLAEDVDPVALARALDGMFAVAVWDARDQRLHLLRDRVGKKPLYWCETTDGGHAFASEIKALLTRGDVAVDLDEEAIPAFLHLGYVPTPRTFFRGIRSVPPGHVLTLEPGREPVLQRYWQPPVRTDGGERLGLDEAATAVRSTLEAAVRRRLVSDVPLGAFLSGGIDSSAIVALMATMGTGPVHTFTIGFDDRDGFDERPWASALARRYGTEHTEFVVEPFTVDLIDDLTWHHDQPFGDSSAIPMWFLSKMTRQHVTVALSGDGGDEVFAGYERFAAGVAMARLGPAAALASPVGTALGGLAGRRGRKLARFATELRRGMPDAYREWVAYTSSDLVAHLTPASLTWALDDYEAIWRSSAGAHPLDRLLDLNLRTYLLDDLLPKVDRTSMAHALEVRSPFLDHHLIELAADLAPSAKARGLQLKRVLRRAVDDLLPDEVLRRPKKGFGVPLARWFRDDLSAFVATRLGPGARVRGHLDGAVVDRLLAEHTSGRVDHGHTIWSLLTLESFLDRYGW